MSSAEQGIGPTAGNPSKLSTATPLAARLNTDVPQMIVAIIAVVAFLAFSEWSGSAYWGGIAKLTSLYLVATVFMSILYVDAGQTSFGQGAIFGASAYAVAVVGSLQGYSFAVAAIAGLGAALIGGVLFALPALRVQWFYLGFVTLSASMVFPDVLVYFDSITKGINGIRAPFTSITDKTVIGLSPLTLMIALVTVGALTFQVWLARTRLGRQMKVAASSTVAAQSLGTSPSLMRSVAFLITALGTGLAGMLYPPTVGFVSPNAFHVDLSVLFFFAIIVGGTKQPLGPVVGLILLYMVPNVFLASFVEYRLLIYGLVALLVMLLMPNGILGTMEDWRRHRWGGVAGESLRLDRFIAAARSNRTARIDAPDVVAIEVIDVRKAFGSVKAVDGVSVTIRRGEIHGLVGANGSGKTSLLNIFSGFSRASAGTVKIAGVGVGGMAPHQIARLGIGRTFQTPRILPGLSVWENLEIGLDARNTSAVRTIPDDLINELRETFKDRSIETIPHGQRRLLEIMRIVLKEADILLLDEPAAGLSPDERRTFSELLRSLRDDLGKTIVLVEHDLDLVWGTADRVTVLETGRVAASGTPQEVAANPAVSHMFIGGQRA